MYGDYCLSHSLISLICSHTHIDSHRNFMFGMNIHICSYYVLITSLLFPTYSYQMAAILVLSFICSPVHKDIHRNFIFGMNMDKYLLYIVITF